MDFLEHYVVSKREDFSDGWSMIAECKLCNGHRAYWRGGVGEWTEWL